MLCTRVMIHECHQAENVTGVHQHSHIGIDSAVHPHDVQVLIIGGCGRVGSAAAIHLLSEGGWRRPMQVTVAGRRSTEQMAPVQREIIEVCAHCLPYPFSTLQSSSQRLAVQAH